MSDANRTAIGIVEEVTPGTTPVSPVFENLRIKGESLEYRKTTAISAELRADRQVTDVITTGFDAGGSIPMEASFGALDTPIRAVANSEWIFVPVRENSAAQTTNISAVSATAYTVIAGDGTLRRAGTFVPNHLIRASGFGAVGNNRQFVAAAGTTGTNVAMAGGTIEASPPVGARLKAIGVEGPAGDIVAAAGGLTSTTINWVTAGFVVGMWVYIGGATVGQKYATAANTGWARVTAVAAGALGLDNLPVGWGVDAGAGKTIRVFFGDVIRNGTTKRTYTVEVQMQDVSIFDYFSGMVGDSIEFGLAARSIVDVTVGWMGRAMTSLLARVSGASDIVAPAFDVLNTSSNVGQIYENGAAVAGANFVMSATISIKNSLRRRNGLGSLSSVDIIPGRVVVDGSVGTYFGDNTIRNKILNSTVSSLMFVLSDGTGPRGYVIDLPRIKWLEGDPANTGVDTDRTLAPRFQALRHPTFGYTFNISRMEEYGT
jgi:hypothetical protein